MKHLYSSKRTPLFEVFLSNAGFLTPEGELRTSEKLMAYTGKLELSDEYISESGGLLAAVSRKSVDILRRDLADLKTRELAKDCLNQLKYILLHCQPHLDEYVASYLFRASLPEEKHDILLDETFLASKHDDRTAKSLWPQSAVFGVGKAVNGGAEPLLLFDEHESGTNEKTQSSLAMLMKRYALGNQRPPMAFYEILRETDYIDQYGTTCQKNLAIYARYLHTEPILTACNEKMSCEWKCALMDASIAAFYLALRGSGDKYRRKSSWQPALLDSLGDYSERTYMRNLPEFETAYKKIKTFLTYSFSKNLSNGSLTYYMPSSNNPKKKQPIEYSLLIPYLPSLMMKYWGGCIGQMLMFPFWESRIYRDISSTRIFEQLKTIISTGFDSIDHKETEVGTISVLYTDHHISGKPVTIIDFKPSVTVSSSAPVNYFISKCADGLGLSIFRTSDDTGAIIITKGERIDSGLWESICFELADREGLSDDLGCQGAWHITKNPSGLAPFLLNGNPTHRYVPRSSVDAEQLKIIVDKYISKKR